MEGMSRCLFVAVVLLYVTVCTPRSLTQQRHDKCKEPKDLARRAQRLSDVTSDTIHPSIYSLPMFGPDEMTPIIPDTKKTSNFLREGIKCPEHVNNSSQRYLDRSTCPFYHVITYDKNRAPATMVEVECKCTECRNLTKGGTGINKSLCQKIYYYTPVLRKVGCNNTTKLYEYKKVYEPISVGCTCAHPLLKGSAVKRHLLPVRGFVAA